MKEKILIIVESPAKTKIIRKYLSKAFPTKHFLVEASLGHVRDLPKKDLGIDFTSGDIKVCYQPDMKKQNVIGHLRKQITKVDKVYLATDNDREGEAIAWHVKELLSQEKIYGVSYFRMIFNEITPDVIKQAFLNPTELDLDLVNSQQARRLLDRIMGFSLSPLLWKIFNVNGALQTLSTGRVQAATLNIISQKINEVKQNNNIPYWNICGEFNVGDIVERFIMYDDNNEVASFNTKEEVIELFNLLTPNFMISDVTLVPCFENPPRPFITTSLQQETYRVYGMSVKSTMTFAQQLYEKGYITYMRTDSCIMSVNFHKQLQKYINETFGEETYKYNNYETSKVKHSQGGHEAIRPTNIYRDGSDIRETNLRKIYELIRKQSIISQMIPAKYMKMKLTLIHKGSHWVFRGERSYLIDQGFKNALKTEGRQDLYDLESLETIKQDIIKSSDQIICQYITAENTIGNQKHLFNEASLIKRLESQGIGRPSTYASILEKLYMKSYIIKEDIEGKTIDLTHFKWTPDQTISTFSAHSRYGIQKNAISPTDIGRAVADFLSKFFQNLISDSFTSDMEDKLDLIACGHSSWKQIVMDFNNLLTKMIDNIESLPECKKVILTSHKKIFRIDDQEYALRQAKYGPVIEYMNCNNDKVLIDLKPYLRINKKQTSDINMNDISFLLNFPKILDEEHSIHYGRYGFYLHTKDENFIIPLQFLKANVNGNILLLTKEHVSKIKAAKTKYLEMRANKISDKGDQTSNEKTSILTQKSKASNTKESKQGKPSKYVKKNKDKYKPKSSIKKTSN